MHSVLVGYEYDIFISYRQNDNRSGWVSEFVGALQEELAATVKESLSVYFDQNPQGGLLETHHVDKSLESKLKCLIFIPIISQTYCDTKSFAWEHEFCAFNKSARNDGFGRDIKLPSGNVASRILPIQIHDLDPEDKEAIQAEIGGVMRPIEFIFKSPGVNRPLRLKDDDAKEITHSVFYRDQINKVANAVKELIAGLKHSTFHDALPVSTETTPALRQRGGKKRVGLISTIFILTLLSVFIFYKTFFLGRVNDDPADNSVAVLAFDDLSSQHDQEWFSDGLTEEILNSLANLHELKVTARTSSFYFKGKDVPFSEISKKLGVAHLVEGSVQKIGDRLRITVQLIRASDEFHIWSQRYDRDYSDLFNVQTEIAESIAQKLLHELTPEKRGRLATSRPANLDAYEYYLKGCKTHYDKFVVTGTSVDFAEAERYLLKSISLDPTYAESYGALADLYDTRSNRQEVKSKYATMRDSVLRIGYRLNPKSLQVLLAYGYSWRKRREPNLDSAFHFFKKAYAIAPDDPMVCYGLAYFYRTSGLNSEALKFSMRYLKSNPMSASAYADLAGGQLNLGNYTEAKINCEMALQISEDYVRARFLLGTISIMIGDVKSAKEQIEKIRQLDSAKGSGTAEFLEATLDASQGQRTQVIRGFLPSLRLMALLGMKAEFLARLDSLTSLAIPSLTFSPEPLGLKNDKLFDIVRNEPQFKIIYERVSRSHDEMMKKYASLE